MAGNGLAEFFIIGEQSGHGYEAVAVSFASAADIVDGLVFIGMERGRPVDFEKLCLWPKGERVKVSVAVRENGLLGLVRIDMAGGLAVGRKPVHQVRGLGVVAERRPLQRNLRGGMGAALPIIAILGDENVGGIVVAIVCL